MELKTDLEQRWFLHQFTNDDLFEKFQNGGEKFYLWVDCSANSMTIGNFIALMMAIHLMVRWNKCYLLVWWATSTIGNPSWKDKERPILSEKQLLKNQDWITKQFDILVKNLENFLWKKLDYEIVNNYNFFKEMNILDFLKEVWRFITINSMISKDIVKTRVEDPDKSISYAEFSYMLIMWYDFYYLNKNEWVTLEIGWSDEWDWIVSWIELVSKKSWKEVYGLTNKLITDSTGKKFGKSEWNAIWLDKKKTSPFKMYQFFLNTNDDDIEKYLKLCTFMSFEEISKVVKKHIENPELRYWQTVLAEYIVASIHWNWELETAKKITEFLFKSQDKFNLLKEISKDELKSFQQAIWGKKYNNEDLLDLLVNVWFVSSRWEAKKSIKAWSVSLNEQKINDFSKKIEFVDDFLLLRKGKKNYAIVLK